MAGLILTLVWLGCATRTVLLICFLAAAAIRSLARGIARVWWRVILDVRPAVAQSQQPGRVPLTARERERRREAWLASVD